MKKSILFVSALDFKEKSIQVIRKTPEAYVKAGWDVHYIVARDNSKYGNYYYEDIINIEGVTITRISNPLSRIINISPSSFYKILRPLDNYLVILFLAIKTFLTYKNKTFSVVYGYEVHGFLSLKIIKLLGFFKNAKVIARFQGVFYISPLLLNQKYLKLFPKWDYLLALKLKSDLCIMTNDGTQGNLVLKKLKSNHLKNYKFWVNGVDNIIVHNSNIEEITNKLNITNETVLISVSRLEKIKRLDIGIRIIDYLVNSLEYDQLKYLIVGEGSEIPNLKELVSKLNLERYVEFIGAIKQVEVSNYLELSHFFISTFESSNVGNPLLEAIRANKVIVTIDNGDTSSWIQNKENGIIHKYDSEFVKKSAIEIHNVINDDAFGEKLKENLKKTEQNKLWTWNNRMREEVKTMTQLCK